MKPTTDLHQVRASTLALIAQGLIVKSLYGLENGVCTCGTNCTTPGRHLIKAKPNQRKQNQSSVSDSDVVPTNICIDPKKNGVVVIKVTNTEQAQKNFKRLKKESKLPETMATIFNNGEYHIYSSTSNIAETTQLYQGVKLLKTSVAILMPPSVHILKNGELQIVKFLNDLPIKKLPPIGKIKTKATLDIEKTPAPVQDKVSDALGVKKSSKPTKSIVSEEKLGLDKQKTQSPSQDIAPSAVGVKKSSKLIKHGPHKDTVALQYPQTVRSHITVKEYPTAMKAARMVLGLDIQELAVKVGMGDYAMRAIESGKVEAFDNYRRKLDPVLFPKSVGVW